MSAPLATRAMRSCRCELSYCSIQCVSLVADQGLCKKIHIRSDVIVPNLLRAAVTTASHADGQSKLNDQRQRDKYMTIQNIKELAKIVDLCRKKGIDSIKIDNVELKLGRLEPKLGKSPKEQPVDDVKLSDEELLYWSSDRIEAV